MAGKLTNPRQVTTGTEYRVFDGGEQVDELRFVSLDHGLHGYAVRSAWDTPERIHLPTFLESYAVVPKNGVPVRTARPRFRREGVVEV